MLSRYKVQVAALFRRYPRLGVWGQRLYRLGQARYSVGAVGVVFDEGGRILLLQHVFHPRHPWGLPGGWVGRNERPADTVVREVREETGLLVRVVAPVWADVSVYPDHLDLAYLCRLEGGALRLSSEILDYRWHDPLALPEVFDFQRRAIEQAVRLWEADDERHRVGDQ